MQDNNINKSVRLESKYWFRKPVNIFLIAVVFVTGCLYLIRPLIELMQAG